MVLSLKSVLESKAPDSSKLNDATDSTEPVPHTVAKRDDQGDLKARFFEGEATSASYADYAENYICNLPNNAIPIGSVMCVPLDSKYETEICMDVNSQRVMGIKSKDPGMLINSKTTGACVGLLGRLPVRVVGQIEKGERLVSCGNGCATPERLCVGDAPFNIVGYALESNDTPLEKLVMSFIK